MLGWGSFLIEFAMVLVKTAEEIPVSPRKPVSWPPHLMSPWAPGDQCYQSPGPVNHLGWPGEHSRTLCLSSGQSRRMGRSVRGQERVLQGIIFPLKDPQRSLPQSPKRWGHEDGWWHSLSPPLRQNLSHDGLSEMISYLNLYIDNLIAIPRPPEDPPSNPESSGKVS